MFRLDGKPALVTGASGGIGAAIARTLHAQGAVVVLSGTRRDALEAWPPNLASASMSALLTCATPPQPDALIEAAERWPVRWRSWSTMPA